MTAENQADKKNKLKPIPTKILLDRAVILPSAGGGYNTAYRASDLSPYIPKRQEAEQKKTEEKKPS